MIRWERKLIMTVSPSKKRLCLSINPQSCLVAWHSSLDVSALTGSYHRGQKIFSPNTQKDLWYLFNHFTQSKFLLDQEEVNL